MTKSFTKAEFYTIESFYLSQEDGIIYEEDRNEEVDTYWHIHMDTNLMDYVLKQCQQCLETYPVIVDVLPRKWAEFDDDGNLEDYGDTCLGIERYIWTGKKLVTEEEYTELVTL